MLRHAPATAIGRFDGSIHLWKRGGYGAASECKRGKPAVTHKTRRLAASSGTMSSAKNPGVTSPGIEPDSLWQEASTDIAAPTTTCNCVEESALSIAQSTKRTGLNLLPCNSGFSGMVIVPDDAVDRQVFSGISRFPHLFVPTLLHSHLNSTPSVLKSSLLSAA
ncbi:hypothetical protein PR048_021211 [Dryococelus australis]|uniref:Uncharacterized protein n=1 Tax=Dryococelus australis TaxID=614101 RepID=A0ABQ9GXP0_9NEOP|nr:hypothetical protein PR048_021211 [Dryococelus australis]